MPIIIEELNKPSFTSFPVNNNRTAWRPYGMPMIMVVPHKRTILGTANANSMVFNVRVYVENVPQYAYVAGHDHVGMRFPDKELYGLTLDSMMLADRQLDIPNLIFYHNDVEIAYSEAQTGDLFDYTTSSGVQERMTYIEGADYYDLSDVLLEVETLPNDTYNIVYSANYYARVISRDGKEQFICIDVDTTALALTKYSFQHPGKVMEEFYRHTPPPYLTNASKSLDTTVALYRPFTDIIQDIMDEQDILERVNWVYDCPADTIPYISALLGWDLPFFPKSLDALRRAVLRRTVELQNLKGSRRAIISIFKLFGYEILISNLWWSSDGKRFIRPEEKLPPEYQSQAINLVSYYQFDCLFADYVNKDFETLEIPLIYRPQDRIGIDDFTTAQDTGFVTIDAYAVIEGSAAYDELTSIVSESNALPDTYGQNLNITEDVNGFYNPSVIHDRMSGLELVGYSQILIGSKLGDSTDQNLVGQHPPLLKVGVSLHREDNKLLININGYYDPKDKVKLFAFATYKKVEYLVPDILKNLQSNKFDIQVLSPDLKEYADPITLDFAIEFVYKLKAFHSLLNVVRTKMEMVENYEVTDLSIGGDYDQRYDTDIGRLQVPPAIIPNIPATITDCALLDARNLGYKLDDEDLRSKKLTILLEEYEAWKKLDNRDTTANQEYRLPTPQPISSRLAALFNYRGQDRITTESRVELRNTEYGPSPDTNSHSEPSLKYGINNVLPLNGTFSGTDPNTTINADGQGYGPYDREYTKQRTGWTSLDGVTDYKYKGRVDDELLHQTSVSQSEIYHSKGCSFGLGIGTYYAYPTIATINVQGTAKPAINSLSDKMTFTGGSPLFGITYHKTGIQRPYLNADYNIPPSMLSNSFLGRLYRNYDTPSGETIHYSDRIDEKYVDQRYQLALQRPSLNIDKPDLHLPGCRFPLLHALKEDFISNEYTARPWDDIHSTWCGSGNKSCGGAIPKYLNFHMLTLINGDQQLTYDSVAYKVLGNNLTPDIPSLGDHTLMTDSNFSDIDVIHKVYMRDATANPAVTFDQVCDYDTFVTDGAISTDQPIFRSYNPSANSDGSFNDYADGYPCVSGYLPYMNANLDRSDNYEDVLIGLGLTVNGTHSPTTYLFTLGSGIHENYGYRLDCGCSIFGMTDNTTAGDIDDTICSSSVYKDENGEYDWEHDHLRIAANIMLYETTDVKSIALDGAIGSLLETI